MRRGSVAEKAIRTLKRLSSPCRSAFTFLQFPFAYPRTLEQLIKSCKHWASLEDKRLLLSFARGVSGGEQRTRSIQTGVKDGEAPAKATT